ncbi:hypothetical protein C5167_006328 [Papaver somniferum]|uniref:Uncharacterized protein n=1 Tax=Papaver somniferum TaxID=3469 RepID=A0A4Y7JG81_PAPSO|nr:hypothetical protein C5167_006328 [Papaver somniferum]
MKVTWANEVRIMSENEEKSNTAEFRLKEVQYIQAKAFVGEDNKRPCGKLRSTLQQNLLERIPESYYSRSPSSMLAVQTTKTITLGCGRTTRKGCDVDFIGEHDVTDIVL